MNEDSLGVGLGRAALERESVCGRVLGWRKEGSGYAVLGQVLHLSEP